MAAEKRYARPGAVRSLAGFLLLAGVAFLVAAVVSPVNQLTQPGGVVPVEPRASFSPSLPGLPAGTSVDYQPDHPLVLSVAELPAGLRLLTEAPATVGFGAVGIGALLLWRVLRSVGAGEPFRAGNARLVAGLAAVVAIGGVLEQVAQDWATVAVREHVGLAGPDSPLQTSFELPLGPLVLGGLLLVVADALRAGGRLETEVEGLV